MLDVYITSLALGGVGLAAMAMGGHTGRGHGHAHTGHGHATHSHAGHAHSSSGHSHAHAGHAHPHGAGHKLLGLMSPRTLFSMCLGFGMCGLVLRPVAGGAVLLGVAFAGAIVFDRVLVSPLWSFFFRFESRPALTLESAAGGDAVAVSAFDGKGHGLVSVEVDGQMIQLLGTLTAADRAYGARIPAGTKLRVDDVDAARNRCTVSLV